MNEILLTFLLDTIDSNTEIELYYNNELIGKERVCEFPCKHHMNSYYGHKVERLESKEKQYLIIEVTDRSKQY